MTDFNSTNDFLSLLYHSLRSSRRRDVIQQLANSEKTSLSAREVAREITAQEENIAIEQATGDPYRNVYNSLSQTHFPTLADAGIIQYDVDRQMISPGSNFTIAALFLVLTESTSRLLVDELVHSDEDTR